MKIQLIRNATLKVEYAGKTILVDPMLSSRGSFESFAGIEKNPIVDLPMPVEEVLEGVDMVLVTHTHEDHFYGIARDLISKDMPTYCQPPDEVKIKDAGFREVKVVHDQISWEGIEIHRTGGKHGSGEILNHMGDVSGYVLMNESEPTLYIIGDSIWVRQVEDILNKYAPDIVVTNSGGAYIPGFESTLILMEEEETIKVAKGAPQSTIIAVHMEALDHCTVTRESLRHRVSKEEHMAGSFHIPGDGEVMEFSINIDSK